MMLDEPERVPPPPPRDEPSFTVAQLNQIIGSAIQQLFPDDLWVEGEISNLNRSRAGHVYFDLIEPATPGTNSGARLSVVLFSQTKQIVNNQLKRQNVGRLVDGMAVRIRAAIDFYEQQGRLQLRMTGIDPRYILAAMAAERDALIARLHADGTTEQNKLHHIPVVPLRIGLVTSEGSAAAADFLTELDATGFSFSVTVCDTRVQGDLAPAALIAALRTLYRSSVDVIVLIRGGGSRGDLAVFDNEELARTIAQAPVAVITGIGHEIDRSVADVVAHTSLKTPTAVAAALAATVARYVEHVETQWHNITIVADAATRNAEQLLGTLARRGALAGREGLQLADERLTAQATNLPKLADRALRTRAAEVDHFDARVRAADPAVLLKRGWSITKSSSGAVVRTVADVAQGDTLVTSIADGTIISNVTLAEVAPSENSQGDQE